MIWKLFIYDFAFGGAIGSSNFLLFDVKTKIWNTYQQNTAVIITLQQVVQDNYCTSLRINSVWISRTVFIFVYSFLCTGAGNFVTSGNAQTQE